MLFRELGMSGRWLFIEEGILKRWFLRKDKVILERELLENDACQGGGFL